MQSIKRRRLVILIVLVCLVAAIFVYRYARRRMAEMAVTTEAPQPVPVQIASVRYGTIQSIVSSQGLLTPAQGASARVTTPMSGRVRQVFVHEGDPVAAGQLLAVIENHALTAQASGAAQAVTVAAEQASASQLDAKTTAVEQHNAIEAARLALNTARADRDFTVSQARIALATTETNLTRVRAGARPQEIAQAELAASEARATQERNVAEVQRQRFLFAHGIVAQRQVQDAETALAVATAAYKSAQQQVSLLRAGARPEDIRTAQLAVDTARQALAQAEASGTARVVEAEAALRQAQQSAPLRVAARQRDARATVATTRQRHDEYVAARVTAASAEVRSPLSGLVSRRFLNPGDMADPTIPVIEVTNTLQLNLIANVPPEEGTSLRPGIPAILQTKALPGAIFAGTVLNVGQIDPQTNYMQVRIMVVNQNARLKVGTFVTADIITATNTHAIVVPKSAIITRANNSVVFTVGPNHRAHQHTVMIDGEQNGMVSILAGVTPGEVVITQGQYTLTDGMAVRVTMSGGS